MKTKIRTLLNTILGFIGYSIIPVSDDNVLYKNFHNLTKAFEHSRNAMDRTCPINNNEIRPELLGRLLGTPPSEAYFIIESLAKTASVKGDVCEFGVAQGETSALIANEIVSTTKNLHLFDSFEGLPKPGIKDSLKDDIFSLGNIDAYHGTMSFEEALVMSRLKDISFPSRRYVIHKGFIEDVLREDRNLPSVISFAYIDFDFYEPIKVTLKYLHTISTSGAIFIVDDYDFFSTGAKVAVDEFILEKNSKEATYEIDVPDCVYGHFAVLTRNRC